jgi:hypothetical protein
VRSQVVMEKVDLRAIIGAVMLNKEYEAGVKAHQGRKPCMCEKPEMRDVMVGTNPDGRCNEVDVVLERVVKKFNLRQVQVDQFLDSLGYKPITAEHDLYHGALEDRLDGDIIMNGDEKPETRDVMVKTNPDDKYNEVDGVKERVVKKLNLRQVRVDQLLLLLLVGK